MIIQFNGIVYGPCALSTEILGSICEFMLKQTKERNMPWLLMIRSNTVEELHRMRYIIYEYVNL